MKPLPLVAFATFFVGLSLNVFPQRPDPTFPRAAELERQRAERAREQNLEDRRRRMRELESGPRVPRVSVLASMNRAARAEWERRIEAARKVPVDTRERYRGFLKGRKTGIFRLLPNYDCSTRFTLRVDGDCAAYVPDTSDYSFRTGNYAFRPFHDLAYEHENLVTDGLFGQGILVSLGNVPIESVELASGGVRFLAELQPAADFSFARATAERFSAGVEAGGFFYGPRSAAAVDVTYALRHIAYKPIGGASPRSDFRRGSDQYNLLQIDGDDRDDITVVFRTVGKDADGGLTIIWKELDRKAAPRIKFAKDEELRDFKP